MRVFGIVLIALVVLGACMVSAEEADVEVDHKPHHRHHKHHNHGKDHKHHKHHGHKHHGHKHHGHKHHGHKHHGHKHAAKLVLDDTPARRCDAGYVEVANSLCCPKDHPVLIDGTCYAHCSHGHDDMVLGAWVGCREMCAGGYKSTVNRCRLGDSKYERAEHARTGVAPKGQNAVEALPSSTVSECKEGFVRVKRQGRGKFRYGGCCPATHPKLIFGRCHGGCPEKHDELTVGRMVACRTRCPAGWVERNNDCTNGKKTKRRRDYPRESVRPKDRIIVPKPQPDPDSGCGNGYVRASNHYCCPARYPLLKGLLCYERCKTGYLESAFGCRLPCPDGWTQSTLQCQNGAHTKPRPGYERVPKPSKLRL